MGNVLINIIDLFLYESTADVDDSFELIIVILHYIAKLSENSRVGPLSPRFDSTSTISENESSTFKYISELEVHNAMA